MADTGVRDPPGRGERVRLRRHELPRRARRARPRPAQAGPRTFATGDWSTSATTAGRLTGGVRALRPSPTRRSCHLAGRSCWAAPMTPTCSHSSNACSPRRVPAGHRHRRDPTRPSGPGRSGSPLDFADATDLAGKLDKLITAPRRATARCSGCSASKGCSSGAEPPAKVAFLYTGQGSQYVNMLAGLRAARADRRRRLPPGRRRDDARSSAGRSARTSSSMPTTPRRWPSSSSSCCRPRSPSPPCWRRTRASPRCWPPTACGPTWSWATASASTGRSSPRVRSPSKPRWRRSAPAGARWRHCRSRTTARWPPCSGR